MKINKGGRLTEIKKKIRIEDDKKGKPRYEYKYHDKFTPDSETVKKIEHANNIESKLNNYFEKEYSKEINKDYLKKLDKYSDDYVYSKNESGDNLFDDYVKKITKNVDFKEYYDKLNKDTTYKKPASRKNIRPIKFNKYRYEDDDVDWIIANLLATFLYFLKKMFLSGYTMNETELTRQLVLFFDRISKKYVFDYGDEIINPKFWVEYDYYEKYYIVRLLLDKYELFSMHDPSSIYEILKKFKLTEREFDILENLDKDSLEEEIKPKKNKKKVEKKKYIKTEPDIEEYVEDEEEIEKDKPVKKILKKEIKKKIVPKKLNKKELETALGKGIFG